MTNPMCRQLCNKTESREGNGYVQELHQRHITNLRNAEKDLAWWRSPDILDESVPVVFPCSSVGPMAHQSTFDWSESQISNWLIQSGYHRYRKMFYDLHIDGRVLSQIDAHQLRRSGVRWWEDCLGLAQAAHEVNGRKTQLNPADFQCKMYPYYPRLYVDDMMAEVDGNNRVQNPVFRNIYKTSGNTFYFYDKMS